MDLVFETNNYNVFADKEKDTYTIINKVTGITEQEHDILFVACKMAIELTEGLGEIEEWKRKKGLAESGLLVPTHVAGAKH